MWVLMYVSPTRSIRLLRTTGRSGGCLRPVVFKVFMSEERCKTARATLEDSLKDAGAKLRRGLEDLKTTGKADPAQLIIAYNVECLPK